VAQFDHAFADRGDAGRGGRHVNPVSNAKRGAGIAVLGPIGDGYNIVTAPLRACARGDFRRGDASQRKMRWTETAQRILEVS
jgi:hypothetical protein